MTSDNLKSFKPSDRISGFKPYFFAQLIQKLNELCANGMDIIRLDMGSPDLPPKDFIIDALVKIERAGQTLMDIHPMVEHLRFAKQFRIITWIVLMSN